MAQNKLGLLLVQGTHGVSQQRVLAKDIIIGFALWLGDLGKSLKKLTLNRVLSEHGGNFTIDYLNKSTRGGEQGRGEPRRIKLQLIKKEQLIIRTERGGVWYCVDAAMTLFLLVLRHNYKLGFLCLIASESQSNLS